MTLHTKLSYIKSAARIVGYILLLGDTVTYGVCLLIAAELVGVLEELPSAYKGTKTE